MRTYIIAALAVACVTDAGPPGKDTGAVDTGDDLDTDTPGDSQDSTQTVDSSEDSGDDSGDDSAEDSGDDSGTIDSGGDSGGDSGTDTGTSPELELDPLGGPAGGHVLALAARGDDVLVGTHGGLWVSADGGATFAAADEAALTDQWVIGVAMTDDTWIASTYDGPYVSTDSGATWSLVVAGIVGHVWLDTLTSDGASIFAVNDNGTSNLFRWDDGTWTECGSVEAINALWVDGDDVFGATNTGGVYVSGDRGDSFSSRNAGLPFDAFTAVALIGDVLYLASADQLWVSDDAGRSWSETTSPGRVTAFAELGGAVVAGLYSEGAARSTDGGESWSEVGTLSGWSRYVTSAASTDDALFVGTVGHGVARTTDGATWEVPTGLDATSPTSIAFSGESAFTTSGYSDAYRLDLVTEAWTTVSLDLSEGETAEWIAGDDSSLLVGTRMSGPVRSTDGGDTWASATTGFPTYNGSAGKQYREVASIDGAGDTWLVGFGSSSEMVGGVFSETGGGVARTTDGGDSWERINEGLPVLGSTAAGGDYTYVVYAMRVLTDVVMLSTWYGGTWRSVDGGDNWSATDCPQAMDFAELDGAIYAAVPAFSWLPGVSGVYVSTDDGATWTDDSDGLPRAAGIEGIAVLDGALIVVASGTDAGVYQREAASGTWTSIASEPLAKGPLRVEDDVVLVGSAAHGMWTLREVE